MTENNNSAQRMPHSDRQNESVRNILGVDVSVMTANQAIELIESIIADKACSHIAFLNAHGANLAYKDEEYRQVLKEFTVLSDGIGVDLGSSILYGDKFPQNLNGTDFIPRLFKEAKRPLKVGLLGGQPGIAEQASETFKNLYSQHEFPVIGHGFFDREREVEILKNLQASNIDVLLVAFGNPRQEHWIAQHCTADIASVAIGVGALFDFVSGSVKRAPGWMISARVEWIYRLWLEPRRMWRRYVLGNPAFIFRIFRQKFFGNRA